MEKFKSLYKDGLVPTKEYHDISKDVSKTIETIFKKYIDDGYSPREITELLHSLVSMNGSHSALLMTLQRKKAERKSLTKDPENV